MSDEGRVGFLGNLGRYVLPVLVLVGAVLGARALIASKKTAPRQQPGEQTTPVRIIHPVLTNHVVVIEAAGHVTPARRVELRAQVAGRVVSRHPSLEVGGRVSAGDLLVSIEPEDYEAAVTDARAALAQAKLNEALERQRQSVAKEEWRRSGQEAIDPVSMSIALREPYVEAARRAVQAAQAGVERAERNLERTRIRAPFDSVVLSPQAEIGAVLAPQSPVAVLAATDTFHIEASVPVSALGWLGPVKSGVFESAPAVQVTMVSGLREAVTCEGRAVRLLGDMSQAGLMARILIAVDHPFAQSDDRLLLGAYVQCRIEGKRLDGVFALPRDVVRDEDTLWIAGVDMRLEIIRPSFLWKGPAFVLLGNDINTDLEVVSSALPAAVKGMHLQTINKGER